MSISYPMIAGARGPPAHHPCEPHRCSQRLTTLTVHSFRCHHGPVSIWGRLSMRASHPHDAYRLHSPGHHALPAPSVIWRLNLCYGATGLSGPSRSQRAFRRLSHGRLLSLSKAKRVSRNTGGWGAAYTFTFWGFRSRCEPRRLCPSRIGSRRWKSQMVGPCLCVVLVAALHSRYR